jgi:ATP-binding cassette subfamily B protein
MSLSADVPTDAERSRHMRTLLALGAHLWPRGRADLRIRLLLAAGFMLAAKGVNVYTPFLYKAAVDQLSGTAATLAVPVFVIFAYGAGRLLTQALGELRDFTFARSAQHAQRTAALSAFKHLHGLSLNFHLSRQTGGLSRVIDRGVKAMQYVLGFQYCAHHYRDRTGYGHTLDDLWLELRGDRLRHNRRLYRIYARNYRLAHGVS